MRAIRSGTIGADPAHQPLGKNADQTARGKVWFDAKIEQSRYRAGRVVGVQRAENQVAGQGGLDGHGGGVEVADFADHDDVGVLPQDAAQAAGEGHSLFVAHLGLADAVELVFDGIFEREDVFFLAVDAVQRGIERGAFSGAGGTGDEDQTVFVPMSCSNRPSVRGSMPSSERS